MPNPHRSALLLPTVALALATGALRPGSASAQSFPEVGARAMAMGGAFVGAASGPTASYWNPAALAIDSPAGAFVYGQSPSDPDDLSTDFDDLASTRALDADIGSRPADAVRAVGLLSAIAAEDAPVTAAEHLGGFYGGGRYGVAVYRTKLASSRPLVDLTHVGLGNDPATGIAYNTSSLLSHELRVDDYVVSFAGGGSKLFYGGSIRYSRGKTYVAANSLFRLEDFSPSDTIDLAESGLEVEDSAWSFDVGTLVVPSEKFRIGVIGKYLGAPKFDLAGGGELELDPRWRTGIAILPIPTLTLSADIDLTETTLIEGTNGERDLSIGGEVRVAQNRVALRGGYRTSLEGTTANMFAGGVGFVGKAFRVDFAAGKTSGSGATAFTVEISLSPPKQE